MTLKNYTLSEVFWQTNLRIVGFVCPRVEKSESAVYILHSVSGRRSVSRKGSFSSFCP